MSPPFPAYFDGKDLTNHVPLVFGLYGEGALREIGWLKNGFPLAVYNETNSLPAGAASWSAVKRLCR